jgi:hypothetical protein
MSGSLPAPGTLSSLPANSGVRRVANRCITPATAGAIIGLDLAEDFTNQVDSRIRAVSAAGIAIHCINLANRQAATGTASGRVVTNLGDSRARLFYKPLHYSRKRRAVAGADLVAPGHLPARAPSTSGDAAAQRSAAA